MDNHMDNHTKAHKVLKDVFGYDEFKPFQYQIIESIISQKDVLGIMPTGYGKSLCFQIIPLLTDEVAIVISPLIALMADQKLILDKLNISSCCYNSSLTKKEKKDLEKDVIEGKYKIMYITPESLVNSYDLINEIYCKIGICMLAIDEAHCLSSYGFDFRPKYREIKDIRKLLTNVPVLCVTATATDNVIKDIKELMNMKKCVFVQTSYDRPNIMIHIEMYTSNTLMDIVKIIKKNNSSTIIYCVTKKDTELVASELTKLGIISKAFHAGLDKEERITIQENYMNDKYKCIVATIAFGMGINKSDVRTVIHYGCPQNIESYYQEIGRAGRDGKESNCYLFYKTKDFIIQKKFIEDIQDVQYKKVRADMLNKMSKYIDTKECRRKYILQYFSEETDYKNCKKCDNCLKKKETISKKDEYNLWLILNVIMTIQIEKNYTFGQSTISLILKGSESSKIKPWMKKLEQFGSMKKLSIKDISSFIYKIIDLGYVENYDIGNCCHVLRCTEEGLTFNDSYELLDIEEDLLKNNLLFDI